MTRPEPAITDRAKWEQPREDLLREARHIVGLYAGQCSPNEYQHLIAAGILRLSYDHAGGVLGMAKLAWADEEPGR